MISMGSSMKCNFSSILTSSSGMIRSSSDKQDSESIRKNHPATKEEIPKVGKATIKDSKLCQEIATCISVTCEEVVVKKKLIRQLIQKFKEGDFVDLHLNDIEDMLVLAVQHKLFHLDESDLVDFMVALRIFTRSLIIKR
ncbi:hypothetical protein Tco_0639857 [Tanacetum coccineum]